MKKLSLKESQRLVLANLLNNYRGGYDDLVLIFAIIEKIMLTPEDRETVELKTEGSMIKWDEEKETAKEFLLEDAEYNLVTKFIDGKKDFDCNKTLVNTLKAIKEAEDVKKVKEVKE